MADLPKSADIVIIGGGVIGLSTACHLAWRGGQDVVLLERHQLTSGTSWHAAGIIGPLRATMNLTRLAAYTFDAFDRLETETEQSTGYRRTGGFWLTTATERMVELRRIADLGLLAGLNPKLMQPGDIADRLPMLNTDDLVGGLWVDEDGQANPVDVCMAFAKAARTGGVRLIENAPVRTVQTTNGAVHAVELADGTTIRCRAVVNCAGAWARQLGESSGVAIPLQAVEHMYVVTEPIPELPQPWPIIRDLEGRTYIKEDAGRLVVGGFEADAKPFDVAGPNGDTPFLELPEDWEQFETFMLAGLNRVPKLNETGIQHFMNGPESFTPDTKQVMGEAPEVRNYFVAAGFNSIGIMSAAGAGRVMADWVIDGQAPMDISDLDITRFEPEMSTKVFLQARVQEAVANQFEMHWPYKRMRTARDLFRLPCHDIWAELGGAFSSPAGWERPMWFAPDSLNESMAYSQEDQAWWPFAEIECTAARDAAAIIDLSPFSKFDITGRGALDDMQNVCSANVDVPTGKAVYTLLLNTRGGIEADGTVTRLAEDQFRFVGAAPSRRRDLAWLRRHITRGQIADVTRDHAVLALMGPQAAAVWQAAGGDLSLANMPFTACSETELDGIPLRALRLSFIGEFGWELYMPWGKAPEIARALLQAGTSPMGLQAVDSCRMEKAFRHWGHDIGPDDTPLDAGLGFAVAKDKTTGFIGQAAVEQHRATGPQRRLTQFAVDGANPLLLHDEPIFRDGNLVAHTTSGARGFRTGLSLCMGYLPIEPGETAAQTTASSYEISVAGERFGLHVHTAPPYDPDNSRMHNPSAGQKSQ